MSTTMEGVPVAQETEVVAKAQSWEARDERLHWPDPELMHIRLHRTIYLGG